MEKDFLEVSSILDDANLLTTSVRYEDLVSIASLARKNRIGGVCVFPCDTEDMNDFLEDSDTNVVTVISFPYGTDTISTKLYAVEDAIESGTGEIDYVINVAALKDKEIEHIIEEAVRIGNIDVVSKAIIELSLLSPEDIKYVCEALNESNVEYIKTCTGKLPSEIQLSFEEKIRKVELIKKYSPSKKIKFSGGIKNLEQVRRLMEIGVDRIGTSATFRILDELREEIKKKEV